MNIAKVKNSAAIVNYVKPGLEMVEMEVENSLLLTASNPGGPIFGGEDPELGGPGDISGGGDFRSSRPRLKR